MGSRFSVLGRQASQADDPKAKGGFELVARRVMSLGQIYDHLVSTEISGMIKLRRLP